MIQLSKSDYMLFLRHPAWLWLKKHNKAKLPVIDDNTQAVFDAGHLFESYAEQLFPNGLRLGFSNYEEYKTLPERTKSTLKSGAKTIFQGRFEHNQLTFICDVIQVVDGNTVDLFEIKSSTKPKVEHEFDLAFQMVVLELVGYTVRNISVVHVNNQYVRSGDINPEAFIQIADITKEVKERHELTKNHIDQALKIANSSIMPDPSPSHARLGSLKDWITIYRGLESIVPKNIYDLFVPSADKLGQLEVSGIKNLIDIPDDFPLTDKQRLQVKATKQDKIFLEKDKIKDFLSSLAYPLYFLDYETLSSVVPYFDGLRSYQQLPFQYSLDVLDTPDGELKHFEYLHRDNTNPAEPLSKSLKSQIGTSGSILTWNSSFETGCNTLLGELVPKYEKFYEQVNNRVVDLMIPFSNSWYVHKDFGGSASIKAVLPVLVPELSYKALAIHEGGAAQRLWMEAVLDGKRDGEKEQILNDLIKYCGLDTLAMVEIYRQILKL